MGLKRFESAVTGRDPHIILFHPLILFSNSFFDFPLFFEYFPIILHDLGTYAALRARLDARRGDSVDVDLTVYYRIYTGRKELKNEDDRAEKAD